MAEEMWELDQGIKLGRRELSPYQATAGSGSVFRFLEEFRGPAATL